MGANNSDFEKLKEMIKDIDLCMLTTVDESGSLHSRPMSLNSDVDSNGNLWFFTSLNSHKASEIEKMSKVNVSFIDTKDQRYVSISGNAELVSDKKKIKELWKPILKAWFPDGPDQADVALLKVNVEKAEYWDSPSSTVAQAISFVSAIFTGKQVELGENKKINLGG
ncbi:MAG TPA: pyridoxamine 5'-phosphate oxidase family protein [Pyrinomonadaceae bacterium]|nr:pyridoxamine 5'-phosphate oxidase family protein [Pyrinomonadaceae bacterium]